MYGFSRVMNGLADASEMIFVMELIPFDFQLAAARHTQLAVTGKEV